MPIVKLRSEYTRLRAVVASLFVSALAACASGPSKSELTRAIDEVAREKVCFALQEKKVRDWPLRVNNPSMGAEPDFGPVLSAMIAADYVEVTPGTRVNLFGIPTIYLIMPTEEAKGWWSVEEGYCVGTRAVADLFEWTEPGKEGTVIQAKFTWHLVDVPPWAKRAEFDSIVGMSTPGNGTALLQRTNNGWKAAQFMDLTGMMSAMRP